MTQDEFLDGVAQNRTNVELLRRLRDLRLSDCYLTAGCLFQPIWNLVSGQPADRGIKDYDVFYFDDGDLSWEAEDEIIRRVDAAVSDLSVAVEVRNQARVHLWYRQRFGGAYPQLRSARAGIERYLVACTCVGINVETGVVFAPNGLTDLKGGILKVNPITPNPERFREKSESYRSRWPWLSIHDAT